MVSGSLKESYVRWGVHWHHLANTTEPSTCGGDEAFLSNYFDYLLLLWPPCIADADIIFLPCDLLWPPYEIGGAIIFLPCGYYLSIFFFIA